MYTLTIEDSNGQVADQFSFDHGSYVIGRLETCDIVLPSSSVSREHAHLFVEDDRCYIEDLGSANGVIVDGQRVIKRRDLGTASQIRIGNYYLYLEFQSAAQQDQKSVLDTLFISDSPTHPKLVRVNDAFAGEEFSLSEVENSIGRTDDNFILLSDQSISRRHANIVQEGGQHLLVDLDSSNGTRLNGRQVRRPKKLKPGDLIEFGDVEFVFTEGDAEVDLNAYGSTARRRNKLALIGGMVALVLFGLALGGLLVFGIVWFKGRDANGGQAAAAAAEDSVQSQSERLLDEGRSQMSRREWNSAIASFDEVLALDPKNEAARQHREQARRELTAEEMLKKGEELSEQGRHKEAHEVLHDIPEGTVAHERAGTTLAHIEKTLAHNLKNEAYRMLNRQNASDEEMIEAHEKLVRSASLVDDEEVAERIDAVEASLQERNLDFEPYAER